MSALPRRAFLGAELPDDGIAFGEGGVRIAGVADDGMAARGGVVAGDVIASLAGLPVRSLCELSAALRAARRDHRLRRAGHAVGDDVPRGLDAHRRRRSRPKARREPTPHPLGQVEVTPIRADAMVVHVETVSKESAANEGIYTSFDAFLKQGIREYYDRGWTTRRGNFIALLIASGTTSFALAKDSVVDGTGTKKVALGAGLLVALRFGLKYALGGPLGLVLTVAAGASMVSYFIRNQRDIIKKVNKYKTAIAETSKKFDDVQNGWRDGKHQTNERNLMIDGLMKQFITQVDES
ncbi:MAG: hypothetical protein KIT31_01400 [Deltaproteobacteria bacterium]|nr:hypothetical protein [Deltaproteobacteria bacterium]